MTAFTISETFADDGNDMPWDEAIEPPIRTIFDDVDTSWSSIDGAPSDDWRRLGQSRRKQLLEEDKRKGRLSFDLNIHCQVDRYFEVAHRAMEQFLTMYKTGEALEETYVMGNRMVTFLTEYLSSHPGFHKPSTAELRKQSFKQLEKLQACLDDLALKIDEAHADKFVENFDPLSNESVGYDSDDEAISGSSLLTWVKFGGAFKSGDKRLVESPTRTVDTSGTDSLDASDDASSDDDVAERRIIVSNEVDAPANPLLPSELGTEFLEMIAAENVEYETDSEAMDSWAGGENNEETASDSSRSRKSQLEYVVCDPAKLALVGLTVKTASKATGVMMNAISSSKPGEDFIIRSPAGVANSETSDPRSDTQGEIVRAPPGENVPGPKSENFFVEADEDISAVYRGLNWSNEELSHGREARPLSFREAISHQRPGHELKLSEVETSSALSRVSKVLTAQESTFQRRGCPQESAVMSEIEKFLDSSFEYDPSIVFESSMERLNARASSRMNLQFLGKKAWPPRTDTFQAFEAPIVSHADNNAWVHFD